MDAEQATDALLAEFALRPAQLYDERFVQSILDTITDWLRQIDLPDKTVVLKAVSDALDEFFAGFDTPGPDIIIEPTLKSAILASVEWLYRRLQGGVQV